GGTQPDLGEPARLSRAGRPAGADGPVLPGRPNRRGPCRRRPSPRRAHSLTHTAGSDSTPFTRTRTGKTAPACPAGGEKENDVPDGATLTWPGPGDAAACASATVP